MYVIGIFSFWTIYFSLGIILVLFLFKYFNSVEYWVLRKKETDIEIEAEICVGDRGRKRKREGYREGQDIGRKGKVISRF